MVESYIEGLGADGWARTFDIRTITADLQDNQPSVGWPVPALMRTVLDCMSVPPWASENRFRRSVWATSALARLGELGIPADAIVRTALRRQFTRAVVLTIAICWYHERKDPSPERSLPAVFPAWFALLDTHLGAVAEYPSAEDMLPHAFGEALISAVHSWLDTSVMAHLIEWRLDGEKTVSLGSDDLLVPGGAEATCWVVDRFMWTELRSWRRESLDWELAYLRAPMEVAGRAGVDLRLLRQRPTSIDLVTEVITSRITRPRQHDELALGLTESEIIDKLAGLLSRGDAETALALLRRATRTLATPALQKAVGFCLIPSDPDAAMKAIQICTERFGQASIDVANYAAALFRKGLNDQAREVATPLLHETRTAWLWAPDTLQQDVPITRHYELKTWADELIRVASGSADA